MCMICMCLLPFVYFILLFVILSSFVFRFGKSWNQKGFRRHEFVSCLLKLHLISSHIFIPLSDFLHHLRLRSVNWTYVIFFSFSFSYLCLFCCCKFFLVLFFCYIISLTPPPSVCSHNMYHILNWWWYKKGKTLFILLCCRLLDGKVKQNERRHSHYLK